MSTASTATRTTLPELPTASVRPSRWWGRGTWVPLLVFLASRLLDAIILTVAGQRQIALPDPALQRATAVDHATAANPGYLELLSNWDGQWYQFLATHGYRLPGSDAGNAGDLRNSWAFPPGFPMTVRVLMEATGLSFAASVTLVNIVAGATGMVILYRMVHRTAGAFAAAAIVLLTCLSPTALLFQVAYSESLALALLCAALLLVHRRRYGWAVVVVIALSLTRVITAPLAVVVAAHAWSRWRSDPASRPRVGEGVALATLAVSSLAGTFLWGLVAGAIVGDDTGATSRPKALATSGRLGWFLELDRDVGIMGPILLACLLTALFLASRTDKIRSLGVELRTWLWCYPLYLFTVIPITSGLIRYLLLCVPLPLLFVLLPVRSRVRPRHVVSLAVVCLGSVGAQVWWISQSFVVTRDFIMP